MKLAVKPYALRIPNQDARELEKAQRLAGQSINQLIVQCIRRGLPGIIAENASTRRVTNVEPLKPAQWRKIYSRKDPLDRASAAQLAGFQSQEAPE